MESPRPSLAASGYVLVPQFFDPVPLCAEFDTVMGDAFDDVGHVNSGSAGNRFRYVPVMNERTPVSVDLTLRLAELASELLGSRVLPGRAKATTYFGATNWHRDSGGLARSIGMVCYLDPLDASTGALTVVPGSFTLDADPALQGVAIPTIGGDVIVFDEHLLHGATGGGERRQWRADFVADTGDDAVLRAYFSSQFSPGWDGGYNVDRYPSYGAHWRTLNQRWTHRLEALGAFQAAAAEEEAVRTMRSTNG